MDKKDKINYTEDELKLLKFQKVLIDDYKPRIDEIENFISRIDDPYEKIKYLRLQESQYRRAVKIDATLFIASGVVTRGNPHKAGLDGWIDDRIQEIYTEYNILPDYLNYKPTRKKNKVYKYKYKGDKNKEVPLLFYLLIGKFIDENTDRKLFEDIFKGLINESEVPIKWIGSTKQLSGFLKECFKTGNWQTVTDVNNYFLSAKDTKVTAGNLSTALNSISENDLEIAEIKKIFKQIKKE